VEIHAREILSLRDRLNLLYVKHTGKSVEVIEKAVERDNFMSPEEAVQFGLIDKVIERREDAISPTSNATGGPAASS
jgi:ATP-dependent Clp protease protease subunit